MASASIPDKYKTATEQLTWLMEKQELEDPARCWIDLVEACRLPDGIARREAIQELVLEAKASVWTHALWDQTLEGKHDLAGPAAEAMQDAQDEEDSDTEEWIDGHGGIRAELGEAGHPIDVDALPRTRVTARASKRCKECGCDPCCCWGDVQ